jgi:Ca-activated chloride channel family protein
MASKSDCDFFPMNPQARSRLKAGLISALALAFGATFTSAAQKASLPRSGILEQGIQLSRDAATGELRTNSPAESHTGSADITPVIRSRVALVEVQCTVTAPDGTRVRGLTRDDFQLWEDGDEQQIASFDAATTPASIVLVIDASPSIYRELGDMRGIAQSLTTSLQPEDEVAAVAFADKTHLLMPFSRDRNLLSKALTSRELAEVANSSDSFIYQATYLSAVRLLNGRAGRKAIVLLTDGQDSELGLSWDPASMLPRAPSDNRLTFQDVARGIAARGIELYVISTEPRPHAMTDEWLSGHRAEPLLTVAARNSGIALYTLYLAELVRQTGGQLYFLREIGSLAEIYHTIALRLEAEYTLGYYPSAGIAKPGWRELKLKLGEGASIPAHSQMNYRTAYYVPALSP